MGIDDLSDALEGVFYADFRSTASERYFFPVDRDLYFLVTSSCTVCTVQYVGGSTVCTFQYVGESTVFTV